MKQGMLILGAVVLCGAVSTPTRANGDILTLDHAPPPSAKANQSLTLQTEVQSDCTVNCGTIEVGLYYQPPDHLCSDGKGPCWFYTSQNIAHSNSAQSVEFTIPGSRIESPSIVYYFSARQDIYRLVGCSEGGQDRDTVYARSPDDGYHEVPVSK